MWVSNITLVKLFDLHPSKRDEVCLMSHHLLEHRKNIFLEVHFLFSSHYSLEWRGMVGL